MKRIVLMLSILFCITAFANNSYADDSASVVFADDCPEITPNSSGFYGYPMKFLPNDSGPSVALVTQTLRYNGECVAIVVVIYGFGSRIGFAAMKNYPTGTDTDISNAYITQIVESCNLEEELELDLADRLALGMQWLGTDIIFEPVSGDFNILQHCPVTCPSGTVLQDYDGWKSCRTCESEECCLTEETTYNGSDYENLGVNQYLCPVSGGSTPARLRMSTLTPDNVDGTIIASGAYAKGAYNANVGNINTALTYVEDSSVETIKHATVSAENVSLSVAGFTPAGTIDVDSSNATVSGTVNVANTVAMLSEWGTNSTANGTLSGSQQVSITNGVVTGMTGSFSGPASGQLSGTGTLSNASVHVNNWVPVNP